MSPSHVSKATGGGRLSPDVASGWPARAPILSESAKTPQSLATRDGSRTVAR